MHAFVAMSSATRLQTVPLCSLLQELAIAAGLLFSDWCALRLWSHRGVSEKIRLWKGRKVLIVLTEYSSEYMQSK